MKSIPLKIILKLYVVAILCLSCNHSMSKDNIALESAEINNEFKDVNTEKPNVSKPKFEISELKIIKSANVRYKVKDVKCATDIVESIALKYNAYVSEMRFDNNLYQKQNRFTLKVPSNYFDVVMDSISKTAEFIEFENISTKDITSEFIDIEARLKTKMEVKQRYEDILRKKARNVEDLLATEEKLQHIQEEIEVSQGRLKYLTNKVAFSTIQVDLYETVKHKEKPEQYKRTFGSELKESFVFGWNVLKVFFLGLVNIWPLIIVISIVVVFIKKRLKK